MNAVRQWLMNLATGGASKETPVDAASPVHLLFYNLTKGFLYATVPAVWPLANPWVVALGLLLAAGCAALVFLSRSPVPVSRETETKGAVAPKVTAPELKPAR